MRTSEEIKQLAIECGFRLSRITGLLYTPAAFGPIDNELQSFYQRAYEEGGKAQVAAQVEVWAQEQVNRAYSALRAEFNKAA